MALNANVQIEVRTGGNDNNGGGFKAGASGTDYTLQDSAQLALTDLATSGTGVTTLTSATGGFTAAMIGNLIQIRSGTNVTAGFYEITGHTDTNTVTLDRAPDNGGGGISGGSGNVGGAMASPGKAIQAMLTDGMKMWIKSGTYTMTTSTPGAAGPVSSANNSVTFVAAGYNATRGDLNASSQRTNKPVISAGSVTGITLWTYGASSNPAKGVLAIVLDANDGTGNTCIDPGSRGVCVGVHALNAPVDGFNTGGMIAVGCEADGCGIGFDDCAELENCVASNNTNNGIEGSSDIKCRSCISFGNGGDGFNAATRSQFADCIAHGNTGDGFAGNSSTSNTAINCLSTGNGAYGFSLISIIFNCAEYNNTSGDTDTVLMEYDLNNLSTDPYVDSASDDFRLNDDAGGGQDLRTAGIAYPGQVAVDSIGGYGFTADAGGGLLTHPGMAGGARG